MQPYKGIKTGIGRARAFLRLALMQKKLPDYLDLLQSSDQSFRATFWEDWSLIRNDEAPEIFGHMQGLSIGTVLNAFYLISQSGIHPETDRSELVRDFKNLLGPGPFRDFQNLLSPSPDRSGPFFFVPVCGIGQEDRMRKHYKIILKQEL